MVPSIRKSRGQSFSRIRSRADELRDRIRGILSTIRVPTLVMNRTGDPVSNVEAARDLASRIPGARFVEFPGSTHSFAGIEDEVLAEIEEFVTGPHTRVAPDRVLATILF